MLTELTLMGTLPVAQRATLAASVSVVPMVSVPTFRVAGDTAAVFWAATPLPVKLIVTEPPFVEVTVTEAGRAPDAVGVNIR